MSVKKSLYISLIWIFLTGISHSTLLYNNGWEDNSAPGAQITDDSTKKLGITFRQITYMIEKNPTMMIKDQRGDI